MESGRASGVKLSAKPNVRITVFHCDAKDELQINIFPGFSVNVTFSLYGLSLCYSIIYKIGVYFYLVSFNFTLDLKII